MKKIAVICILQNQDHFLLILRGKEPHTGKYSPVGGKLESHESPRQAAVREVMEETGYQIFSPRLMGLLTESSPTDYNWILYVFHAKVDFFTPPDCNEGELKWVKIEKLSDLEIPVTDLTIYSYILREQFFVLDAEYDQDQKMTGFVEEISGEKIL
ncbi:MAG: NUDIX domain-containing protein [Anaerolineales bacterium]|nr:NUDIX domain-containing protein [Anaerolineales bacterium]